MKWLSVFLVPLLVATLALACEEDEKEAATATPSPAITVTVTPQATPAAEGTPTPEATPTAGPTAACPSPEELAPYWPPQGTVTYSERLPRIDVDVPPIAFDQVEMLAIACGDARGQGQEAYVAYQATLPPGSRSEESAMLTVLAVLDQVEGSLVNIGALPDGVPSHSRMHLQDLTGDGKDEIIFDRPGGASWGVVSIWSWQEGNFREVFRGVSYLAEFEFLDLDGDGGLELVTHQRRFEDMLSMRWPTVHRWDGHSFRPALFSDVYDDVISAYLGSLELGTPDSDSEIALRTTLGHLYERQGRTAEARVEYGRAWGLYEAGGHQPSQCADAPQAVQDFYLAIGQGVDGGTGLTSAYSMLGTGFRQAQSFPDFAAGFARTEDVMLVEPPEVSPQDGDLSLVSAWVVTHELTSSGEIIERFAATWRVRQEGQLCVLESARLM